MTSNSSRREDINSEEYMERYWNVKHGSGDIGRIPKMMYALCDITFNCIVSSIFFLNYFQKDEFIHETQKSLEYRWLNFSNMK